PRRLFRSDEKVTSRATELRQPTKSARNLARRERRPFAAKGEGETSALPSPRQTAAALLGQPEDEEPSALGLLLVPLAVVEGPDAATARPHHDRDVLMAAGRPAGWVTVDPGADIVLPERFAGVIAHRREQALGIAEEHKPAPRRQDAAGAWRVLRARPHELARRRVVGLGG